MSPQKSIRPFWKFCHQWWSLFCLQQQESKSNQHFTVSRKNPSIFAVVIGKSNIIPSTTAYNGFHFNLSFFVSVVFRVLRFASTMYLHCGMWLCWTSRWRFGRWQWTCSKLSDWCERCSESKDNRPTCYQYTFSAGCHICFHEQLLPV